MKFIASMRFKPFVLWGSSFIALFGLEKHDNVHTFVTKEVIHFYSQRKMITFRAKLKSELGEI